MPASRRSPTSAWRRSSRRRTPSRRRARCSARRFTCRPSRPRARSVRRAKPQTGRRAEVSAPRRVRGVAELIARARGLTDRGELDAALEAAKQAVELDPKDATAFAERGRVRLRRGELDDAFADA